MTTLHLGVLDQPYDDGATTFSVAEILEAKYHVMEIFYELRKEDVAKALEKSIQSALDMLDSDAPAESINPFATASADIEASFKQFLDSQEIERIGYPGVPTQAALDGVRTSYKNPTGNKKKRGKRVKHPRRPSFIDTGLYEDSMKAWID